MKSDKNIMNEWFELDKDDLNEIIKDFEKITLSTGKEIDANKSIIGIDDKNNVYDGYDSEIYITDLHDLEETEDGYFKLNKQELIELADIMIIRWNNFKKFMESK